MDVQPVVPSGLLSDDRFVRYEFEGVEKRGAWLPLDNGIRLNVSVPVQEINAEWQRWSTTIIGLFAVLLVAFALFIAAFTGRVTRPLVELTKAAERIGEGRYDFDLGSDKNDEVGVLTRTFKKVTADLNAYFGDLNDMAFLDALTGVGNRMALRRDYDSYLGHEVSVMMLDLNDFKAINDTHGHDEGDRVLKRAGELLADTFGRRRCYRYGGDEFLVIMPDVSASEFQKLVDSMGEGMPAAGTATTAADFSIGHARAMACDPGALRELIHRADERMYEAKREKKRASAVGREAVQG